MLVTPLSRGDLHANATVSLFAASAPTPLPPFSFVLLATAPILFQAWDSGPHREPNHATYCPSYALTHTGAHLKAQPVTHGMDTRMRIFVQGAQRRSKCRFLVSCSPTLLPFNSFLEIPTHIQPQPTSGPTTSPTARGPSPQPTDAPTPVPVRSFTNRPTPSPTRPPLPPQLPVQLSTDTNRATVYPGLTFQYTVTLKNTAPKQYVCDPLCRYIYGDFGLTVFLPPSLRLVHATAMHTKGFFPTVSGGNISWPNAPIGNGKSLQYKMTLEVVQEATDGTATIAAASNQNVLNTAGAVIDSCCVTVAPPATVAVVTTTRRSPGSNAPNGYNQPSSNMAGKAGTSVVQPVYTNAGGEHCSQCLDCLNRYVSSAVTVQQLRAQGGLCSLACKSCPSFVETNAGERLVLQAPNVVLNGNTTVNGQMAISGPVFTVITSGPQLYEGSELTFASKEDTFMLAGTTWTAVAEDTVGLRSGNVLVLQADQLASLKSQTYVVDVLGRSLMVSANHTAKTSGPMLYTVGSNLEWLVADGTTLQTGTYTMSATGSLATAGAASAARSLAGTGPPTTMQVTSDGFTVSTQGDVGMQCTNFATTAARNVSIQAQTLKTVTSGGTSVTAGGAWQVVAGQVAIETPGVVLAEAYSVVAVAEGPVVCESSTSSITLNAYDGVTATTPGTFQVEAGYDVVLAAGNVLNMTSSMDALLHADRDLTCSADSYLALSSGDYTMFEAGTALTMEGKESASLTTPRLSLDAGTWTSTVAGKASLSAAEFDTLVTGLTNLTSQKMFLKATDATSSIPWQDLPQDIEAAAIWLANLLTTQSLSDIISNLADLTTTMGAEAFTMSLAAAAKLDLTSRASTTVSSDLLTSISGRRSVSLIAGAFGDVPVLGGSISLGVGPEFFVPGYSTFVAQPQLEIKKATFQIRSELMTIGGQYGLGGVLTIESFTNVMGDLSVEGATEFTGEVNVLGTATFEGEANFVEAVTIEAVFNVVGPTVGMEAESFIALTAPDVNIVADLTVEGFLSLTGEAIMADIKAGDITGGALQVLDITCGDITGGALQVCSCLFRLHFAERKRGRGRFGCALIPDARLGY